ncbi:hypothetical protein [Paraflavitalea sp. CAU 1676]|uniref:hypothetical protein n=1 Tax=Paraflavitalea sp. CAU 1676 TaxID=3032598 RepID=UPI0023DA44C5|nr:hypothetical protein [Paraflavitalea sp. CAU 1676]MDF2191514.1 hypothetical protein [Paraflavitalea sp. CAU 1676]
MTQMHHLATQDGSVLVPVLDEAGMLVAYLAYPNPTGVLQEYYGAMSTPRPLPDHPQSTPWQISMAGEGSPCTTCVQVASVPFRFEKPTFSWAGQHFSKLKKLKHMATTASSNGVSADRIKNDPLFERTRENMAEFTRAGKASKLMRVIFREVMVNAKDKITQARLVKVFSRVLAADTVNGRGLRTVHKGDLQQLDGFNFNVRAGFRDVFFKKCAITFNRTSGQVLISIPEYVPRIMVQGAQGCTHYRIVAGAATIQFDTEKYEFVTQGTTELSWNHDPQIASSLTLALPANSPDHVVVVLGVEFYQRVNSRSYALKTGEFNATSVMLVDEAPGQATGG